MMQASTPQGRRLSPMTAGPRSRRKAARMFCSTATWTVRPQTLVTRFVISAPPGQLLNSLSSTPRTLNTSQWAPKGNSERIPTTPRSSSGPPLKSRLFFKSRVRAKRTEFSGVVVINANAWPHGWCQLSRLFISSLSCVEPHSSTIHRLQSMSNICLHIRTYPELRGCNGGPGWWCFWTAKLVGDRLPASSGERRKPPRACSPPSQRMPVVDAQVEHDPCMQCVSLFRTIFL